MRLTNSLNQDRFIIERYSGLNDIDDNTLYAGDIIYDEVNDVYGVIYDAEYGFVVDFNDIIESLEECNLSCEYDGSVNEDENIIPWKNMDV